MRLRSKGSRPAPTSSPGTHTAPVIQFHDRSAPARTVNRWKDVRLKALGVQRVLLRVHGGVIQLILDGGRERTGASPRSPSQLYVITHQGRTEANTSSGDV